MDERGKMGIAFDKYLADFLEEDGKKMAELSGGKWEEPLIRLPYLGGTITVNHNDGAIEPEPKELLEKILIYKYLLEVQGIEGPGDDFIAFIQLPCGSHHQKFSSWKYSNHWENVSVMTCRLLPKPQSPLAVSL